MSGRAAFVCVIAGLCLVARPALAEDMDRHEWWLSPGVQTALALTALQIDRLDAIYRTSLPLRRRLRRQLALEQRRLARTLATGPFDDVHARAAIDRVCALEKRGNIARTWMLIQMYRVLTADQRAALGRVAHLSPGYRSAAAAPSLVVR